MVKDTQNNLYCCVASVASEQQHNQDLRRIYKTEYEFSNSSLSPECFASTGVHCATFHQSVLRHELHEDVTPSSRVDFSEKG